MGYDSRPAVNVHIGAGAAKDVSATGVYATTYNLVENARVYRIMAKATVDMSSAVGVQIQCLRRPTYGSSSGQSILGTVTIPAAATAAAGVWYYKDITPVVCNAGDQLVFNVSVAANTSGSAIAMYCADYSAETAANESVFTASA